jgi:hypothetical protein
MIIRLSRRLAGKIHETELPFLPPHPDKYLDWYGHVFVHNRAQYVIVINCATIFTVVFHGAGVTDFGRFMQRFCAALSGQCDAINAGLIYRRVIAPATASVRLAKAAERCVTGCMNEQIFMAKVILDDEELSPFDLSKRLNENLLSRNRYLYPKDAFVGATWDAAVNKVVFPEGKE